MIIKYEDNKIIRKREKIAERIFNQLPYRYCFITGSFIYKEKYKDIDVFIITRSKKKVVIKEKRINIQVLDFNDLHSLFYHSVSKKCIAKNILPKKSLRVTVSDYWDVVNEAVPTMLNEKTRFRKHIRDLVLYTEYFKYGTILSSIELTNKINQFKRYGDALNFISREIPKNIRNNAKSSYIKKFFYTWAGSYKDLLYYDAQRFLYNLSHAVIEGAS